MRKLALYIIGMIAKLFKRANQMENEQDDKEPTAAEIKANLERIKSALKKQDDAAKNDDSMAAAWALSSMFGEVKRVNKFNQ